MPETLVFDASPLCYFARSGLFDQLPRLSDGYRRVITRVVANEIKNGVEQYPSLSAVLNAEWLEEVRGDSIQELLAFAAYSERLVGDDGRNEGEAATLAWAEVHGATAIVDDRAGVNVGREHGVDIRGTLSLIASGVRNGVLSNTDAICLVDALTAAEAWFPCTGDEFLAWARTQGLL